MTKDISIIRNCSLTGYRITSIKGWFSRTNASLSRQEKRTFPLAPNNPTSPTTFSCLPALSRQRTSLISVSYKTSTLINIASNASKPQTDGNFEEQSVHTSTDFIMSTRTGISSCLRNSSEKSSRSSMRSWVIWLNFIGASSLLIRHRFPMAFGLSMLCQKSLNSFWKYWSHFIKCCWSPSLSRFLTGKLQRKRKNRRIRDKSMTSSSNLSTTSVASTNFTPRPKPSQHSSRRSTSTFPRLWWDFKSSIWTVKLQISTKPCLSKLTTSELIQKRKTTFMTIPSHSLETWIAWSETSRPEKQGRRWRESSKERKMASRTEMRTLNKQRRIWSSRCSVFKVKLPLSLWSPKRKEGKYSRHSISHISKLPTQRYSRSLSNHS